jgi:hypothetical protein
MFIHLAPPLGLRTPILPDIWLNFGYFFIFNHKMIEPEIAFCDLPDVMECAEEYVKFCIRYALDNNITDLEFLADH